MTLTPNETAIVQAILDSEYGDAPTDDVWYRYVAEESGIAPKSLPGVMSSLSKKDLAHTDGVPDTWDPERMGPSGEMPTIWLTEAGVAAAVAAGLTARKLD